jgi:hypothetical protein
MSENANHNRPVSLIIARPSVFRAYKIIFLGFVVAKRQTGPSLKFKANFRTTKQLRPSTAKLSATCTTI